MLKRFRRFLILIGVGLVLAIPALAQDPTRFGAFGLGYFSQASPQFQGWAALAIPLTADGKAISYSDYDIAVTSDSNYQMTVAGRRIRYTMKTGIGYRVFQRGQFSLFGLAAPGFTADGDSFRSAFSYGGFGHYSISNGWGILIGVTNETYAGNSDLAPRIGVTKKF